MRIVTAFKRPDRLQQLRIILLLVAVTFGLLYAWVNQHYIWSLDGISYLDVGDAYFRGDWDTAINGYWSPLYPWLLGLAMFAFKPSPYWEFSVVQLVNLVIYLFALVCFSYLLHELILYRRGQFVSVPQEGRVILPEWAVLALGYSLFVWSSLYWVYSWLESPDVCLSAFIYLAAGILLRIQRGAAGRLTFAALGLVLGLAYLTKAVMFPLAFIFLLVSLFPVAGWQRALSRVLIALAVFLLVTAPLIVALSRAKGRLTFGDTGRLNYAWYVNEIGLRHWPHWQGEEGGKSTPLHPARKLLGEPTVYEFRTPAMGTYAIWYDPSYWCDGMNLWFAPVQLIHRLKVNLRFYFHFFFFTLKCSPMSRPTSGQFKVVFAASFMPCR